VRIEWILLLTYQTAEGELVTMGSRQEVGIGLSGLDQKLNVDVVRKIEVIALTND